MPVRQAGRRLALGLRAAKQPLPEYPSCLLYTSPTNHLDLQATEWLEGYLRRFRGTVLTISHDRYFLDRTVTRIIEIPVSYTHLISVPSLLGGTVKNGPVPP